jgi:hypothetical protein
MTIAGEPCALKGPFHRTTTSEQTDASQRHADRDERTWTPGIGDSSGRERHKKKCADIGRNSMPARVADSPFTDWRKRGSTNRSPHVPNVIRLASVSRSERCDDGCAFEHSGAWNTALTQLESMSPADPQNSGKMVDEMLRCLNFMVASRPVAAHQNWHADTLLRVSAGKD